MSLTHPQHAYLRHIRGLGILTDIVTSKLRQKPRAIAVACADGERSLELIDHHRTNCGCDSGFCFHIPFRNGGHLSLAPNSPIATRGDHPHHIGYLIELKESAELKGANFFPVFPHFPCGAAGHFGINPHQSLCHALEAVDLLRAEVPGADVGIFPHVDYDGFQEPGESRFNTYGFDSRLFRRHEADLLKYWQKVEAEDLQDAA